MMCPACGSSNVALSTHDVQGVIVEQGNCLECGTGWAIPVQPAMEVTSEVTDGDESIPG